VRSEEQLEGEEASSQGGAGKEALGADLLESSSVERDWECWGSTG